MNKTRAAIDVCIPVYNASAFIAETLDNILSQDFPDFRVLVSVDRSTDGSAERCKTFSDDPRVVLYRHTERMGYVGNVNFLIRQASAPFLNFTPHDDLPQPGFLTRLHRFIESDPGCSVAIPTVVGFGEHAMQFDQHEVRGPVLRRLLDVIMNQRSVAAFHGLVRIHHDPEKRAYLPTEFQRDFEADVQWMARLALQGELRRVPGAVTQKRFTESMTSRHWTPRTIQESRRLSAAHTARLTELAFTVCDRDAERDKVMMAALLRLKGGGFNWGVPSRSRLKFLTKLFITREFRIALTGRAAEYFEPSRLRDWQRLISLDRGVVGATVRAVAAQQWAAKGNLKQAGKLYHEALQMDPEAGWKNEIRELVLQQPSTG